MTMELDPILKEAAHHIASRFYCDDWAEVIGQLIHEMEVTATSSDYSFAPVTAKQLAEFLDYLSQDIQARQKNGEWPTDF